MDNLSHTLLGVVAAHSGWQQKHGPIAGWTIAIGANLPDIDAVVRFWGTEKDRKSTRLNSSHIQKSRMPSSA